MASISLDGITKNFGAVTALNRLQLDVEDGEFFVLLGPSGAGKTTTLRVIAGLEHPDIGQVKMDGEDVTHSHAADRDCAFVFQQYSLYPHLSVYDNIAFPLRSPLRRVAEDEVKRKVRQVAEMLHIESKLERKATALSGGEMQRVAIGRALVRDPRVFLMDEPLSSLDAKLREELRVELKRIQRELGATVIYVTHDQVEATTMADRIGILEAGQLRQVGTAQQIYEDPSSVYVAQRLGSPAINLLPASWFSHALPPGAAHVAIRPEDVRVVHERDTKNVNVRANIFSCRVDECSLLKHQLVVERDGQEIFASTLLEHQYASGDVVHLEIPAAHCLYFAGNGRRLIANQASTNLIG
jgi:multiple sugar transport system ATP-binding protein